MMKEDVMTQDDKDWSNGYTTGYMDGSRAAFDKGKIEGFNKGIKAALKVLRENDTVPKSWFFEEIEKLKRQ